MLEIEQAQDTIIFRTSIAELGADTASEFKETLLNKLEECPWAAIDLSNVTFMDSSALGVLVAGLKAVRGVGQLRLFGVQERVDELFRLTGLSRVFQCDPNQEAAEAALHHAQTQAKSA